jgi:hypothetical protein
MRLGFEALPADTVHRTNRGPPVIRRGQQRTVLTGRSLV